MVRSGRNVVLVVGCAVLLASCGGGGSGPAPTPVPVAKTFSPTGTLTMTSSVDSSGFNYTATIQLAEHGGLGGSMGNIDITYKQNGAALATLTFESCAGLARRHAPERAQQSGFELPHRD